MTRPPTENPSSQVGTHIAAIVVVVLLVGAALLNLPSPSVPLSKPYVTIIQGLNVRRGPGVDWNPPLGSLDANLKADILARSVDGKWLKIKYRNGTGWIIAAYTNPSINILQLPVDSGPSTANLVLSDIKFTDPLPLTCDKTVGISVSITNSSSDAMSSSGTISIRDLYGQNQQEAAVGKGAFPPIPSGQSVKINDLYLTVSSFGGELHRLVITLDADGNIPDVNDSDNSGEFAYRLKGDC